MDITSITQEIAEVGPETTDYRNVRQRAIDAGATELCIIIQYSNNLGAGVMRCLVDGIEKNVPAPMWKAVEWLDGYVVRDTPDEGGMVRYVVGPVDFEDARRRYKEEYRA